MDEIRSEVQNLDDPRVWDLRRGVSLRDQLSAFGTEQINRARVGGHYRAADVADALALRLELDARGGDVPLIATQLIRRDTAQISLDDEEGHAN